MTMAVLNNLKEVIMRKALCVGIDSYKNISDLHGCVNDANSVKSALERNGMEL